MVKELVLTPWSDVLESNGEGVGKSGWFIKAKDGGHFQVGKKDYLITKRDLTTDIKSMKEVFSRGKLDKTQVVENLLPVYFVEGIQQNHPDVYANLYDHLANWDFKAGGAAKGPKAETVQDKGVAFLVSTLRNFAPLLGPDELKEGLRGLVNDDAKMEKAVMALGEKMRLNKRDSEGFIMLRAESKKKKK